MQTVKARKLTRMWDNYHELFEVQKSDRIKLVVAAGCRDGVRYINIREFYLRQRDQEWRPGRDGITIPDVYPAAQGTKLLHSVDELIKVLPQALETLRELPLADPEYEVVIDMEARKAEKEKAAAERQAARERAAAEREAKKKEAQNA